MKRTFLHFLILVTMGTGITGCNSPMINPTSFTTPPINPTPISSPTAKIEPTVSTIAPSQSRPQAPTTNPTEISTTVKFSPNPQLPIDWSWKGMPNLSDKVDVNTGSGIEIKKTFLNFWSLYSSAGGNTTLYRNLMDLMPGEKDETKSRILLAVYEYEPKSEIKIRAVINNILEVYIHGSNADVISEGDDPSYALNRITVRTPLVWQNNSWKIDLTQIGAITKVVKEIREADLKVKAAELNAEFKSNKILASLKYMTNPPKFVEITGKVGRVYTQGDSEWVLIDGVFCSIEARALDYVRNGDTITVRGFVTGQYEPTAIDEFWICMDKCSLISFTPATNELRTPIYRDQWAIPP